MHYKDVIARSLVSKYNSLKSSKAAIPHALWFYPHGRGQGKHSGKIHYHIEYMVKKDKQQIHQPRRHGNVDIIDGDDNNMLQTDDNNQNDPAMVTNITLLIILLTVTGLYFYRLKNWSTLSQLMHLWMSLKVIGYKRLAQGRTSEIIVMTQNWLTKCLKLFLLRLSLTDHWYNSFNLLLCSYYMLIYLL